jgi:4-hydroxy-tetrahydrodipicolinate synthase
MKPHLISAIGTPLDDEGRLHKEGLNAHLADQWEHGIHGVLIAGTMGVAQLLSDEVYEHLVQIGTDSSCGHGEVFVGVGDAGYDRTRHRIEFVNRFSVDGIVVLTPYLFRFSESELVDYFRSLADVSHSPLYLYEAPAIVGVSVPIEVVLKVASHPNIHGIKCSCPLGYTKLLAEQLDQPFRIVHAQPLLLDMLLRYGESEHLDGIFSLAPAWACAISNASLQNDWRMAQEYQRKISALIRLITRFGIFASFSTLLNARGIPGNFAPRPYQPLSEDKRKSLLLDPVAQELIGSSNVLEVEQIEAQTRTSTN